MTEEATQELRGAAMRGLVQAVHDDGLVQTVDVQTHDGMVRAGIEVFQPYGFATCALVAGSVVQLMAIGADPGDLIAMLPVTPAVRYGNLLPGEVALYDAGGQRVTLRQGGEIDIFAASVVNVGALNVVINAPLGVTINGPVTINGDVAITGTLTDNGVNVGSTHTHGGVETGGGETGPPA